MSRNRHAAVLFTRFNYPDAEGADNSGIISGNRGHSDRCSLRLPRLLSADIRLLSILPVYMQDNVNCTR